MRAQAFVTAANQLSELERLSDFVTTFWTENQLPEDLAMEACLVLEEVFSNVVLHAYEDSAQHEILVQLAIEDGTLILSVEDDGIAFNPLEVPPADTSLAVEERAVGGLGIHLVRSLMDEVKYARREEHNRLEMRKNIPRSN